MKKRNSRGITLIALVITIIVLLILAAVSIVTLTGENGILTQVGNAKEENERSQAKEEVKLALGNLQIEESQSAISQDDKKEILEEEIKQFYPKQQPESTVEIEGARFLINHRGYQFEVDENYNVLFIEPFDAEDWNKEATPEDCFYWKSDDPNNEGYSTVIGYTAKINNYTKLRYPSRCTQIGFGDVDTEIGSNGMLDDKTTIAQSRAFTNNILKVEIPETVTKIGKNAFGASDCYSFRNLQEITIPRGVTSIGDYAFFHCTSLSSIEVDINNANYSSEEGVLFNKDKETLICYPAGKEGSYKMPNSVTSLERSAFSYCTSLSSIEISNSLTNIESYVFTNCTSLSRMEISSSVTSIKNDAFEGCTNLSSIEVDINNANYSSEEGVLFNKDKETLICYPNRKEGSSYTIPSNVRSIGDYAFKDCTSLSSITISSNVASIGNYAFRDCTSLSSIEIPSSVTSIGMYAFQSCRNLRSITIPSSVSSIRMGAFSGWTSSQTINIQGYSSAPSGWSSIWNERCQAKINWGQ